MYSKERMGGWLLFMALVKWLSIIMVAISTISIVVQLQGYGIDSLLIGIALCGIVTCAAEFVQFWALKNKTFFAKKIETQSELVTAFYITEIIATIALCITSGIVSEPWFETLAGQFLYIAVWSNYLKKSQRVQDYLAPSTPELPQEEPEQKPWNVNNFI